LPWERGGNDLDADAWMGDMGDREGDHGYHHRRVISIITDIITAVQLYSTAA
jgi:hypothetical protein